jgi:micrococcal nuclease
MSLIDNECKEVTFENCCWKNTKPYLPNLDICKIIKCYDADTITAVAKLEGKLHRFSIRLAGIDSPELRSKNSQEKAAAIEARDWLSAKILGKFVKLKIQKREKFGRLLADVFLDGENMNELLVTEGYAKVYDGKKKSVWLFEDKIN